MGRPDILGRLRGGQTCGPPLGSLTAADWDVTMAVNLTAPFLLGQRFDLAMADRGWGWSSTGEAWRSRNGAGRFTASRSHSATVSSARGAAAGPRAVNQNVGFARY